MKKFLLGFGVTTIILNGLAYLMIYGFPLTRGKIQFALITIGVTALLVSLLIQPPATNGKQSR